jgi:hypothetical protein
MPRSENGKLKHVGREASFVVEGHRYRYAGHDYFVFTAGDGEFWDAAPVEEAASGERFGLTVVRAARSRKECVAALADHLGASA